MKTSTVDEGSMTATATTDTVGTDTADTSATSASTTEPSTTDSSTTDSSTTDPSTSTTGACVSFPDGVYGDCVNGMAPDACGGMGSCIVDDPDDAMNGVCFIEDCVDVCDCWEKEPNDNSTSVVACDEIVEGGGNGCFLDCQGGMICPTGMICFADFICMWELQP